MFFVAHPSGLMFSVAYPSTLVLTHFSTTTTFTGLPASIPYLNTISLVLFFFLLLP
jgi:hypothetical protein